MTPPADIDAGARLSCDNGAGLDGAEGGLFGASAAVSDSDGDGAMPSMVSGGWQRSCAMQNLECFVDYALADARGLHEIVVQRAAQQRKQRRFLLADSRPDGLREQKNEQWRVA